MLVGFAIYLGTSRVRSRLHREPSEDELSRKVMTRASSLAYYISRYLWLFIMYISDKTSLEAHSLVGVRRETIVFLEKGKYNPSLESSLLFFLLRNCSKVRKRIRNSCL